MYHVANHYVCVCVGREAQAVFLVGTGTVIFA